MQVGLFRHVGSQLFSLRVKTQTRFAVGMEVGGTLSGPYLLRNAARVASVEGRAAAG